MGIIHGIVYDNDGNPVSNNIVRVYRRDTGELIGEVLSNSVTPIGQYTIDTGTYNGEVNVIALDNTGKFNDLIYRTIPE